MSTVERQQIGTRLVYPARNLMTRWCRSPIATRRTSTDAIKKQSSHHQTNTGRSHKKTTTTFLLLIQPAKYCTAASSLIFIFVATWKNHTTGPGWYKYYRPAMITFPHKFSSFFQNKLAFQRKPIYVTTEEGNKFLVNLL